MDGIRGRPEGQRTYDQIGNDMAHDIMMKGLVATYLASPQGQEMVNRYLSSAEGQVSIRDYLSTPDGKQTAQMILPLVLDVVDLPEEVKNSVRTTMGRKP